MELIFEGLIHSSNFIVYHMPGILKRTGYGCINPPGTYSLVRKTAIKKLFMILISTTKEKYKILRSLIIRKYNSFFSKM